MCLRPIEFIAIASATILLLGCALLKQEPKYGQTECVYNLKTIHNLYINYAEENGGFVSQVSTNKGGTMELANQESNAAVHFRAFAYPDKRTHYLACPLDKRARPTMPTNLTNTNISYFLSLNAPPENAQWILSGTRNVAFESDRRDSANRTRKVVWNSDIGLHGDKGYLLFLDGTVTGVDSIGLGKLFNQGGNRTNRLAIP